MARRKKLEPVHPGEILLKEFLVPLGISQYRLAEELDVPRQHLEEIVSGKRTVTVDIALRLARVFGTTGLFWLNLQAAYDRDAGLRQE